MRQSVFMCIVCITEFNEFTNLQDQSNGFMYHLSSTQLIMLLEELLHLNSIIQHGSRDHHSSPNHIHVCRKSLNPTNVSVQNTMLS